MFEGVVCIDLGAAYTKVGFRERLAPTRTGECTRRTEVVLVDGSPLIPSLVIRVGRGWYFGQQAAGLTPGPKSEVFENWKAGLFRPVNDQETMTATIVAREFFDWLRVKVENAGINAGEVHVRVGLPAFAGMEEHALALARCMALAGWESPQILRVTEPYGNTVGLLAQGRNVVARNWRGDLTLHYTKMLSASSQYIRIARNHTLHGVEDGRMSVLVIDLGAFTTDIAALTFDTAGRDDEMGAGLESVEQSSYELGIIRQLDAPVLDAVAKHHSFHWSQVRFEEKELIKRNLYSHKGYSLILPERGTISLGDAFDLARVEDHTRVFGEELWMKVSPYVEQARPNRVFLTGGGSSIELLTKPLIARLRRQRIAVETPTGARRGPSASNRLPWDESGEPLTRLATAIGGASVILQTDPAPRNRCRADPTGRPPPNRQPIPTGFQSCRCQGGNKDCCFCGGSGYHRE